MSSAIYPDPPRLVTAVCGHGEQQRLSNARLRLTFYNAPVAYCGPARAAPSQAPTSAALTVQFRPTCAFFVLSPGRPLSPARTPWVRREGGVAHGRGDRRWPR